MITTNYIDKQKHAPTQNKSQTNRFQERPQTKTAWNSLAMIYQ